MHKTPWSWIRLAVLAALTCATASAVAWDTVGDRVWEDVNRNGLQDPGEPGLAGVQVWVMGSYGGGSCSGFSRPSDANGAYAAHIFSGTRCVLVFNPPQASGYWWQPTVSETWDGYYDLYVRDMHLPMRGNDSDVNSSFNGWSTPSFDYPLPWVYDDDDWSNSIDAGFVRWFDGGVTGTVWNDRNRNGRREAGEPLLAGVQVDLMVSLAQVDRSVASDAQGRFSFSDLRSDWNYLLRVVPPGGWAFTGQDVGDDLLDNDFAFETPFQVPGGLIFRLDSGEVRSSFGAGLFDPAAPPVPEPATWALWAAGLAGLALRRRR